MKSTMLLIARTDSESGKLISSNIDIADHEFILGTTTKGSSPLAQTLAEAETRGAAGADIDRLEKEWTTSHEMCTFNQGKATHSLAAFFNSLFSRRPGYPTFEHYG
jgi:isocitrate lyase